MNEPNGNDLHARFRELRESDSAHAPSFEALRDRAGAPTLSAPDRRPPRPIAQPVLWIAIAATVVLAAGALLRLPGARTDPSRVADSSARAPYLVANIADWRSPTAGFLRTPSSALVAPRAILGSILDRAAQAPVQRSGDSR